MYFSQYRFLCTSFPQLLPRSITPFSMCVRCCLICLSAAHLCTAARIPVSPWLSRFTRRGAIAGSCFTPHALPFLAFIPRSSCSGIAAALGRCAAASQRSVVAPVARAAAAEERRRSRGGRRSASSPLPLPRRRAAEPSSPVSVRPPRKEVGAVPCCGRLPGVGDAGVSERPSRRWCGFGTKSGKRGENCERTQTCVLRSTIEDKLVNL